MINGSLAGFVGVAKLPVAIAGGVTGLVIFASAFGFSIIGPGDAIREYKVEVAQQHEIIDNTFFRIDNSLKSQMELLEALVRGECLGSAYDKLALQGLSNTCDDLGIERASDDAIDREFGRN